jgi:hypothetical protein
MILNCQKRQGRQKSRYPGFPSQALWQSIIFRSGISKKNVLMKRYLLVVPLLLCGVHARADTPAAVAESNYQAGLTGGDTYISGNRTSNFWDLSGSANFPLGTYFGTSLSGDYIHTNITSNPFPDSIPASAWPSCVVESENLDAGLFARKPSLGRIGVAYGAGRQKSQCNATFLASGTDTLKTHHSTADAEYYFSMVTVGVSRTWTTIESGPNLDSDTLTASWYPYNDMRLTLAADGLDLKDTYHLSMEYQPEFLDNFMSLVLGYTTQRQTVTTHIITFGLNYYFGTNVDLLARDRQYR